MCESPLSPSNHCFGINKIDRSYVLNRPTILPDCVQLRYLQQQQILSLNQVCLYEARIVLKQSTSLVGGKLKFKQWKITKAKGTKFNYANRYIKIKLGSILQRGVNWKEMVRKRGEFVYKCSGINVSQVFHSDIHKRTIKYSNSLADRQQDCTFTPFPNGRYTQQRTLAHQLAHLELTSQ